MNRREALKYFIIAPFILNASTNIEKNQKLSDGKKQINNLISRKKNFEISMFGDLDDDLIILKSTPKSTVIADIHQMHNSKGTFVYNNNKYNVEHNPGFIQFKKSYEIENDDIYLVCLANEREDAGFPKDKRFRTHYKNEKLFFNKQVLLNALMPEYDSVQNYPLWFEEDEVPRFDRKDINGNTYNYYNLFENTIVQVGIVIPDSSKAKVMLFDEKDQLRYTFDEYIDYESKYLKSNELLAGELGNHKFTEISNILNTKLDEQIPNESYINSMMIESNGKMYSFELPYPIMYPNLISGVACVK